jgi:hypothetical protein
VANWNAPQPKENQNPRERVAFELEIWTRLKFGSFSWTPPLVGATTTSTFVAADGGTINTREVIGLRVGMPIKVTPPAVMTNGLSVDAVVLTNDALTIAVANTSAGGLTPPAGSWSFMGVVI